jgi:hypothetical protein
MFETRLSKERNTYKAPSNYTGMTADKIVDLKIEIKDENFKKGLRSSTPKWRPPRV